MRVADNILTAMLLVAVFHKLPHPMYYISETFPTRNLRLQRRYRPETDERVVAFIDQLTMRLTRHIAEIHFTDQFAG